MSNFLYKNFAGQNIYVVATSLSTGRRVAGLAAGITGQISKDGGAFVATNDTNPTDLGDGVYVFNLTQAETNADVVILTSTSSNSDIVLDVVICPTASTLPDVNVVSLSGSSTAADNSELFFTNVGFNASNSQIGSLSATGVDGFSVDQALRLLLSFACGTVSGATPSSGVITFRAANASGTTRMVMTVDTNGNRSSVTLTP